MPDLNRRDLAFLSLPLTAAGLLGLPSLPAKAQPKKSAPVSESYGAFPSQDPARVRDVVRFAHFDLDQVQALVTASPALANAAVDWGFGDWETAIGAASHMGRRDIAEALLDAGARPDLFTHAMLGNLGAVQEIVKTMPGIQSVTGPHGFTLLHHAQSGGGEAKAVVEYLEALGGADPKTETKPLPAPLAAYLGTYVYGTNPTERFKIVETRGSLGLKRGEGFPRTLNHIGDNAFFPAGAQAVRIRVEMKEGKAQSVAVFDPELLVTGKRPAGI